MSSPSPPSTTLSLSNAAASAAAMPKRKRKNQPTKSISNHQTLISNKPTKFQTLANGDDDDDGNIGFSLKTSSFSHSSGVQPLGNLYMSSSSSNSRDTGLGNLKTPADDIFFENLGFLCGTHLGILCVYQYF